MFAEDFSLSEFVNYTAVCRLDMGEGIGILVWRYRAQVWRYRAPVWRYRAQLYYNPYETYHIRAYHTKCQVSSYITLAADQSLNPNYVNPQEIGLMLLRTINSY